MSTVTTKVIFNVDRKIKDRAMLKAKQSGFTMSDYLSFALRDLAEGKKRVGILDREFEIEKLSPSEVKDIKKMQREAKKSGYITAEEFFKEIGYKPKFIKSK